jgi:hypothetical protein
MQEEEKQKGEPSEEKLITKIIKVKYADVKELEKMLWPFVSREKGVQGRLTINESYNTITIHDLAEKIAVIEEVIKQFDIKPAEVEFTFHLLEASDVQESEKPVPPVSQLPPDVKKVVEKLQTNFTYKHYYLLDSAILKSSESKHSRISLGGSSNYMLDIRWSLLSAGSSVIKISSFDLMKRSKNGGPVLNTSLMIEDNVPVVVGFSKAPSDDKALITIVKARILKD